ncbi:aspartate kinase [Nitrogeniibacter mangrovi]|uniref:Aspartate kinase n=1 Tax=Nitrogeniibacter mangrovi TaxID=2016596 RepID=A0A6C1AZ45_9RHOO|nr:aspartate kinase [Nitrogeniibacter mangrovi]QID16641.1 aspartate kinase [Nitrogeniibacter mangrovi]
MWVIKIGGQLADDPVLTDWLDEIADLGGGRVVLVPGGGDFARQAWRMRDTWQVDTLTMHNIAVLGMGQFAFMLQALRPEFSLCALDEDILDTLHAGRIAIWMPLAHLRHAAQMPPGSHASSDGLALWLAERLNAEKLVLVKSSPLPPHADWAALVEAGVVEAPFADAARAADTPVTVLDRSHRAALHEMLIDSPTLHRYRHQGLAE